MLDWLMNNVVITLAAALLVALDLAVSMMAATAAGAWMAAERFS